MAGASNWTNRRPVIALGSAGAAILFVWAFFWWSKPPQLGADEAVFRAVDALFTAVTARDEKLLGQCEQRLQALRVADKLPAGAARYLEGIVATARNDRWERAAEALYDFMVRQRREGETEAIAKKRKNGATRI